MKLTPWYLVAVAPVAVAGCTGAFIGHCAVLAVTLCIFIGTLSLGRRGPAQAMTKIAATSEVASGLVHPLEPGRTHSASR
jgi:hypothetical protein